MSPLSLPSFPLTPSRAAKGKESSYFELSDALFFIRGDGGNPNNAGNGPLSPDLSTRPCARVTDDYN